MIGDFGKGFLLGCAAVWASILCGVILLRMAMLEPFCVQPLVKPELPQWVALALGVLGAYLVTMWIVRRLRRRREKARELRQLIQEARRGTDLEDWRKP